MATACGPSRSATAPELAGFVGLAPVDAAMPFAPAVEIGWRLGRTFWGRGIAAEAARATIDFAFGPLGLASLVSFTAERNAALAAADVTVSA